MPPGPAAEPSSGRLVAAPNPFVHGAALSFGGPAAPEGRVRILDAQGRLIQTIDLDRRGEGGFSWNGLDVSGRKAAPGVYFGWLENRGSATQGGCLIVCR